MESRRFVFARVRGVPIDVTPAWFIVAAFVTIGFAPAAESAVPGLGPWRFAVSLAFALMLYLSVLVHEISHTLVALQGGLPVRRISLHLLGGVSEIGRPAPTPGREAAIAVAGPAVSLLLAVAGYALGAALPEHTVGRLLAHALMVSNLVVGVFNLLPGLPLDGGRVVAAAVWRASGRRHLGVVVAAWVGRGLAVVVVAVPLGLALARGGRVEILDAVWAILVGTFIWVGASQSLQHAALTARLPAVSARALTRRAVPVEATLPLSEALRRAGESGAGGMVVVSTGGDPVGLVVEAAVQAVPPERRPWIPVSDLSRRLEPGHQVKAHLVGEELLQVLSAHPASEYLVLDEDDRIYGILAAADVEHALRDGPVTAS